MRLEPGGEPFLLRGGESGCLLVHGFSGTPLEMFGLGQSLHEQGHTVLGIRLCGHATEPGDLLHVRASDWLANLQDGYHLLRGSCSRLMVIGFSLGGVLVAHLAPDIEVDGLVLIAMPLNLPKAANRYRPILPILKHVWRYRVPSQISDWYDLEAERQNLSYPRQPLNAIGEVIDLVNDLPAVLAKLDYPTLLVYSKDDGTVASENAHLVFDMIPSQNKKLVWIEGSGHNLPRDAQRTLVSRLVIDFIQDSVRL